MYTVIHNEIVNTFNTVELYNLAIMSILFTDNNLIAEKCFITHTAIIKAK